ncbi:MAG: class I SAM-dependent methyltransferase [Opitutaceae bacterium]|nr:class I SAM-dependent methyltransferase [Opitutaceae bacterium]
MKTQAADMATLHEVIYPALTGNRRFLDFSPNSVHFAHSETAVFQSLLSNLRPACSIEVGTETGATLALIARHSTRTISIDIDPGVKSRLQDKFENVEFITGSSHDVLPVLLSRLTGEGVTPDFIFVDGDHSAAGVLKDLEFILKLTPTKQMIVLMHDTFNPGCRQGILAASWTRNPHCHFVDLDFCPGVLHPDDSCTRQMWGGLGLAVFLPQVRKHTLEVKQTHRLTFEAAFLQSVYNRAPRSR